MILEEHFDYDALRTIIGGAAAVTGGMFGDIAEIDDIESTFERAADDGSLGFGSGSLWRAFKSEMYLLICTDDRKYQQLRQAIEQQAKRSEVPLVSTIAVFVGAQIGVAAGVLTPFCAIFLAWALKVGQETACRAAAG